MLNKQQYTKSCYRDGKLVEFNYVIERGNNSLTFTALYLEGAEPIIEIDQVVYKRLENEPRN
jgi:hypothetical protein